MKKKTLAVVLALLMCVSLFTAGFAAWVITGNGQDQATGNIKVEDATDSRLGVTVEFLNEKGTAVSEAVEDQYFVFGDTNETISNHWCTNETKEDLTVKLQITVTNTEYLADSGVSVSISAGQAYEDAVTAGYVAALPTLTVEGGTNGVYTVEITLGWGTTFGSVNPGKYFAGYNVDEDTINNTDSYADNGAYADATLDAMYELLNEVQYTVTVSALAK